MTGSKGVWQEELIIIQGWTSARVRAYEDEFGVACNCRNRPLGAHAKHHLALNSLNKS